MTNDATGATSNQIEVYDASSRMLLQTLSTQGKGGAGGNARGVRQYDGELFAAVNNGSNTVAVYKREGDRLKFQKLVKTTSAPVSIDFGRGHMYIAGATTVDSFVLHGNDVEEMDGTTGLDLAQGGQPAIGETAQVGVLDDEHLLVTVKDSGAAGETAFGTVDVVPLKDGAITGAAPTAVPAPAGSLTPFGFAVYRDGTAVITLAHSNQDGLFRGGAFVASGVIAADQTAPCWATRVGKYVFTANAGSKTISRLIGTGSNIFIDSPVAAEVTTGGGPTDIDAANGVLGVNSHVGGTSPQSYLSLFTYDEFGELTATGSISLGASANGVAIIPPAHRHAN